MGNTFIKSFPQFGRLGPKSMSFFVYQSTVINQKLTFKNLWYFLCAMRLSEFLNIINRKLTSHIFGRFIKTVKEPENSF